MPTLVTRGAASVRGFGFAGTTPVLPDPYFNYTTLLLHGNGTNGGQNNTFLDSGTANGGVGFDITRNGNTTQGTFSPFSQTGWSNYLSNATGSYIVAANNTSYVFGTGDFTVEFWVFWTGIGTASDTRLMAIGSDYPSSGLGLVIYRTTGDACKARVLGNSTGGTEYTIASGASDWSNKWVHMAVTRSGSTLRTFLNGTLITTATDSSDLNGTNGIQFGRYTGGGDLFTGYLSNVRLTKGGALYTASFTPPVISLTTTVSSGTVGFLGFQSNRFIDNSGNNIALTLTGTPSVQAFSPFAPTAAYSASTIGGSGYFDGSGDYLTLGGQSAFVFGTGDFTIEMFAYVTNTANTIFDLRPSTPSGAYITIYMTGGVIYYYANGANQINGGTLPLNQWVHIVASRVSSNTRLFINGAQVGSTYSDTTNYTTSGSRPIIGADGNVTGSTPMIGYLSSLRVVKGSGVTSVTVPTAPLTNITNTSLLLNFTNAAIIDNTAKNVLETVADAQISTTQSKFGGASLYFDGNGDSLTAPNNQSVAFGTGNFTVEFWAYCLDTSSNSRNIFDTRSSNTSGNGMFFANSGTSSFAFGYGLSPYTLLTVGGRVNNQWQHVAVVRSGSTITIYVDGVSQGTLTNSTNWSDSNLRISGFVDTQSSIYAYYGYLDDFRITKGIARYTSNFTPQTSQWQDQ